MPNAMEKLAQLARDTREKASAWGDWKVQMEPASVEMPGSAGAGGLLGGLAGGALGAMNTTPDELGNVLGNFGVNIRGSAPHTTNHFLPMMKNPQGQKALSGILRRLGKYGLVGGGLGALAMLAGNAWGRNARHDWNSGLDQLDQWGGNKAAAALGKTTRRLTHNNVMEGYSS